MTTTTRTEEQNRIDALVLRMVRTLDHLTVREVDRLNQRNALTENMRVALAILVEDASQWSHDNFDVPHFRGNRFYEYFDNNPEFGPLAPCAFCHWAPCRCDDEVPF